MSCLQRLAPLAVGLVRNVVRKLLAEALADPEFNHRLAEEFGADRLRQSRKEVVR